MLDITKRKKSIIITKDGETISTFELTKKTFYNNYNLLSTTIKEIVNDNEYSVEYFVKLLSSQYQFTDDIIKDYEKLIDYTMKYIDRLIDQIDLSKYVDKTKRTSSSLFLDENDIRDIIKLSYHMKIFSFIFNSNVLSNLNAKRKAFSTLVEKLNVQKSIDILYEFVDKRTISFKVDKTMWTFLKLYSRTPEIVKIDMFNFVVETLLAIFEPGRSNIVGFIVNYIDRNINWIMMETYDDNIVTDSTLSQDEEETVDIVFKSDFIATCSYEHTISKLTDYVKKWLIDKKINIGFFETRCNNDLYVTRFHSLFILPLISKITNIDYNYLNYLMKDKVTMFYLQAYTYIMFEKYFANDYKHLLNVLPLGLSNSDLGKAQVKLVTDMIIKKDFSFYNFKHKHNIAIRLISEVHNIMSKKHKLKNIFYDSIKSFNFGAKYIEELLDIYNQLFSENSLLIEFLNEKTHKILTDE
jgi:hypothetical protein